MTAQQLKELFKEMAEDFRMGQEEAARSEFMSDVEKLRRILKGPETNAHQPREPERDKGRER